MVAVFSYAYFTKSKNGNVVIDDSNLVKQITNDGSANNTTDTNAGAVDNTNPSDTTAGTGEQGATPTPVADTTVVQKGEGFGCCPKSLR